MSGMLAGFLNLSKAPVHFLHRYFKLFKISLPILNGLAITCSHLLQQLNVSYYFLLGCFKLIHLRMQTKQFASATVGDIINGHSSFIGTEEILRVCNYFCSVGHVFIHIPDNLFHLLKATPLSLH
jgi:hypothetical protein